MGDADAGGGAAMLSRQVLAAAMVRALLVGERVEEARALFEAIFVRSRKVQAGGGASAQYACSNSAGVVGSACGESLARLEPRDCTRSHSSEAED